MLGKKKKPKKIVSQRVGEKLKSTIKKDEAVYFDLQSVGISLRELAVDVMKIEQKNVTSYWFQADHDVDFYIWMDDKHNIIRQQVSICGQIIEWNIIDGVKTGCVIEGDPQDNTLGAKADYDPTKEVNKKINEQVFFDKTVQSTALYQAIQLISSSPALKDSIRDEVLSNFQNSPSIHKMKPELFLARFGARSKELTFTQKLANWFNTLFK